MISRLLADIADAWKYFRYCRQHTWERQFKRAHNLDPHGR